MDKSKWFFLEGLTTGAKLRVPKETGPLHGMECVAVDALIRSLAIVKLLNRDELERVAAYVRAAAKGSQAPDPAEAEVFDAFVLAVEREIDARKKQSAEGPS